jgi:hypothetical protein
MDTKLTVRARFFSRLPIETRDVLVDEDGTIRVWDDVAGHYTVCHSLTRSAARRVRRMASECVTGASR